MFLVALSRIVALLVCARVRVRECVRVRSCGHLCVHAFLAMCQGPPLSSLETPVCMMVGPRELLLGSPVPCLRPRGGEYLRGGVYC